jgi:predicted metalloenzyme YecM
MKAEALQGGGHMSEITVAIGSFPKPPALQSFHVRADEVVLELTRAYDVIRTRAEEFVSRQADLANKCDEIQRTTEDLVRRTATLEERESVLGVRINDFQKDQTCLAERESQLAEDYQKLQVAKDALVSEHSQIENRQADLDDQKRAVTLTQKELDAARASLHEQRDEFAGREAALREFEVHLRSQAEEIEMVKEGIHKVTASLESAHDCTPDVDAAPRQPVAAWVGGTATVEPPSTARAVEVEPVNLDIAAPTPIPAQQELDPTNHASRNASTSPEREKHNKLRRDARRRIKGLG